MRKKLSLLVVLLLVGAYAAYAVSQPKLPEVKGCVNPFREVKPVEKTPENWSSVRVFTKILVSKDLRSLAKPWEVDYKSVRIVRHIVDYNGERIEMLAMGIPLKDGKHVIGYYEFSKPVQGVKTRAYLFSVDESHARTQALSTNGQVTILSSCPHECSSDADCGILEACYEICCEQSSPDPDCVFWCCDLCGPACLLGPVACLSCSLGLCPWCYYDICRDCLEEGSICQSVAP
ncbi:hypothetical protein [Thermococcus litoralis]|uniref:hypothetical protein n=1 Tax=Thermococcus litoralis TaxID=2265 RepID=UPI000B35E9C7|nr:hypothetical protein [Thermococcus litoralis]